MFQSIVWQLRAISKMALSKTAIPNTSKHALLILIKIAIRWFFFKQSYYPIRRLQPIRFSPYQQITRLYIIVWHSAQINSTSLPLQNIERLQTLPMVLLLFCEINEPYRQSIKSTKRNCRGLWAISTVYMAKKWKAHSYKANNLSSSRTVFLFERASSAVRSWGCC